MVPMISWGWLIMVVTTKHPLSLGVRVMVMSSCIGPFTMFVVGLFLIFISWANIPLMSLLSFLLFNAFSFSLFTSFLKFISFCGSEHYYAHWMDGNDHSFSIKEIYFHFPQKNWVYKVFTKRFKRRNFLQGLSVKSFSSSVTENKGGSHVDTILNTKFFLAIDSLDCFYEYFL